MTQRKLLRQTILGSLGVKYYEYHRAFTIIPVLAGGGS